MLFAGGILLVFWAEISLLVRAWLKRGKGGWQSLVNRYAVLVHVVFLVTAGCLVWGYWVEPYWLDVSEVRVKAGELADSSLRVVHFSDLHCDPVERCEEELVAAVNAADADIVVFTGDMLNPAAGDVGHAEAEELFRRTMGAIEAKAGKFAVSGNWEWRNDAEGLLEGTGFVLLDGERQMIEKDGAEVCVTGLGYGDRPGSVEVAEGAYNILLYHTPDLVESVEGFDLYLCGHTHGGQVALPWYGALITFSEFGKKYEAGRYEVGGMDVYVSRGIGMEGGGAPRVRFCARPEVTVFEIGGGV
ncbi:putative metallophosphoesterase [Anaerohalosphaera lusitana]|uniref:Putative metallophosphoesterase n=2 Tax=Anaerohalosphaera lusitana TaxID=1936003 RepID=A0A1U9NIV6_9BACT|nr:putative metallophosphoesterase [Anaerohalosphaera lusitana]